MTPEATIRTEIVIIAALTEKNRVIGRGDALPWHIPEDLKRFKRLTETYPMIVGRRTFEAIVQQFGGPLPNRRMLVVTSGEALAGHPNVETFPNIEAAFRAAGSAKRVFIGGGATIYEQLLEKANRLELTIVESEHEGDTFFPEYEHLAGKLFEPTREERHDGFRFVTWEQIRDITRGHHHEQEMDTPGAGAA